jgi:hypothetical protein
MQEWKASSNGDIAKKFDGLLEMTSGLIRGYLAEKVISKIQDPSQSDEEAKHYWRIDDSGPRWRRRPYGH